jgi:hypothetical protein
MYSIALQKLGQNCSVFFPKEVQFHRLSRNTINGSATVNIVIFSFMACQVPIFSQQFIPDIVAHCIFELQQ